MGRKEEEQLAATLAKAMAMICVRNSMLEDLHAGPVPVTKAGDYSDVFVIDADGNRIPWVSVSRFDDDEMRDLMRQVVNRLYTFQTCFAEPQFQAVIDNLDRKKTYPREAQRARLTGTVVMRFTLDANGRLVSASIAQSSGVPALDEAAVALVHQASPYPTPPAGISAGKLTLRVPIAYNLR